MLTYFSLCNFIKVGNSHPPSNIMNTHLWYECDYSVITPKITEINPNYFNGFYLKI